MQFNNNYLNSVCFYNHYLNFMIYFYNHYIHSINKMWIDMRLIATKDDFKQESD